MLTGSGGTPNATPGIGRDARRYTKGPFCCVDRWPAQDKTDAPRKIPIRQGKANWESKSAFVRLDI